MFYQLEQHADQACIIEDSGKVHSYSDLVRLCQPLEQTFEKHQHATGSRALVLVLCKNNIDSVLVYLAALRSNAVVMLLSDTVDDTLCHTVLNAYQPNYICCPQGHTLANTDKPLASKLNESCLIQYSADALPLHPELALMLSTSGSTGSPKFVRLSHDNINANAKSIAEYLALDSTEKAITVLPMPYSYGLSVINSHLLAGGQLLLTEHSLMTKDFWALFSEHQVSSIAGVPYTYEMLKRLRFERRDLSHLKSMTQAGGKLDPELISYFAELAIEKDIKFYVMYGQTEATARISYVPADKLLDKVGSIGLAIPDGRIEVQAIDDAANDGEGELIYHGPNVMLGYAETLDDLSLGDTQNGILPTGDIGRVDQDGFYYVTGRLKRIIKMFGNRINLDDIDKHLHALNVEGVSGGQDNELQVMVTSEQDLEPVKASLVTTFKFDHRAVTVFHMPSIPRNDSGKIQYAKIFEKR